TITAITSTPSTSADADFAARCSAPGVLKCQGMNTMGTWPNSDLVRLDVDNPHSNIRPRGDGQYRATVDTSIMKSGAGSLRFQLDAGYANSNVAGSYIPNTNDGLGMNFGQNTDWYVQFAVRFSGSFLTNYTDYWNSTPKISLFHQNQISCGSKELTTNMRGHGSSGQALLVGYLDCGANGFVTFLDGVTYAPGY